jgi:hypothetical protein
MFPTKPWENHPDFPQPSAVQGICRATPLRVPRYAFLPTFPRSFGRLSKTPPPRNPRSMQFWSLSPHTSRISLAAIDTRLCVAWKTPPQTPLLDPLFQHLVSRPTHFWKPCTHLPASIHADLVLLSTLPPTTTTATRNISTFTLFCRSVLASPTTRPYSARRFPAPHKMPPEIHSLLHSHKTPLTP